MRVAVCPPRAVKTHCQFALRTLTHIREVRGLAPDGGSPESFGSDVATGLAAGPPSAEAISSVISSKNTCIFCGPSSLLCVAIAG